MYYKGWFIPGIAGALYVYWRSQTVNPTPNTYFMGVLVAFGVKTAFAMNKDSDGYRMYTTGSSNPRMGQPGFNARYTRDTSNMVAGPNAVNGLGRNTATVSATGRKSMMY